MKLALSLLALVAGASAFAPASPASTSTSLKMSETPLLEIKTKVPCFGATPLGGEPVFIGENYWDKLTTEYGSEATGAYLQAAEIKHGRSAMVAVCGFAFHKFGLTLNNISPHEYLSVTQGVKFADLAAMTPLEAAKAVPVEGIAQVFAFIAAIEIYELTHRDGAIVEGQRVPPGLQAGGLTGDLGWNPLGIKVTDRRRLVEIQNGRAAMFAICAWVAHDAIPGSVPIPLLWE
jgi:Chlorophyll A-B binding protein